MPALSLNERRFRARGLNVRNGRRWAGARFMSLGRGNRATLTAGTGNAAYRVWSMAPGTVGNSTTFRIVVAGASTAASVAVVGSAVTFNSATSAGSAATSTVNDMCRMVNSNDAARALLQVHPAVPGSDGTGTVVAIAATALAGAT